jgi:hypothetical protein
MKVAKTNDAARARGREQSRPNRIIRNPKKETRQLHNAYRRAMRTNVGMVGTLHRRKRSKNEEKSYPSETIDEKGDCHVMPCRFRKERKMQPGCSTIFARKSGGFDY